MNTRLHYTREEWLHQASVLLAQERFAPHGFVVPPINVSVGFPYRARGQGNNAIGQCWHGPSASNGCATLFVSPILVDTARVVGVLAHELVHATVGNEHGHKGEFARCAELVGLVKPWTATTETEEFKQWVTERLVPVLGEYPHPVLTPMGEPGIRIPPGGGPTGPGFGPTGAPKQGTRLIKAECPSCGYVIRTTRKWAGLGLPTCPCPDHRVFELAA